MTAIKTTQKWTFSLTLAVVLTAASLGPVRGFGRRGVGGVRRDLEVAPGLLLGLAARRRKIVLVGHQQVAEVDVALGKAGIQSTIEFADDERIENVAVGDSNAWQITPNRRASLSRARAAGSARSAPISSISRKASRSDFLLPARWPG